jgi:hypothetical protein
MKLPFFLLLCILSATTPYTQNVGIGTTSPAFRLDVGGRMRVKTGTLGNVSSSSGIWLEDYRDGSNRAFIGMQDSIRVGFYGNGPDGFGWGLNFNTRNGNVGIGIANALSALHVHSPENTFNSYLRLTHSSSGTSFSDGAYMGLDGTNLLFNNGEGGDVIFTLGGGVSRLKIDNTGNVGIEVTSPTERLHISGNLKLQSATAQLLFHNNTSDRAAIQLSGESIEIGTVAGNTGGRVMFSTNNVTRMFVSAAGELNRPRTGNADVLPIAFGRVLSNGTVANIAGATVVKNFNGSFNITLIGEDISDDPDAYTVIVNPFITGADEFDPVSTRVRFDGDDILVEFGHFNVVFQNHADCGCTQNLNSYISGQGYANANVGFSFLVYKQ